MNEYSTIDRVATVGPPPWQTVLRWLGVLPGACLAAIIAGILGRIVFWLGSSRFGDDSWFYYIWKEGITAGAQGAAFVWAAAIIAPSGGKIVGMVFAGIVLFLSGLAFFVTISNREWMSTWAVVATNVGAIGMAVHVFKDGV